MKTRLILFVILGLLIASFASVAVVGAQTCQDASGATIDCPDSGGGSAPDSADPDGDGTVAPFDNCPTLSGPNNNAGCPAGDEDGDGVANESDTCPLEAGAVGGNGCPEAADATAVPDSTVPEATTEPNTSVALPEIPADGRCMAATVGQAAVNVRVQPDQNAAVVGALDPSQTYAVVLQWMGPDGLWYRIANPAGWVFSGVTRLGGDCANIQTLDPAAASGAVPSWGPNGELTFCQPNYELGEDTCVPSPENTQASYVPSWDELGNLTFCIPDYEIGEEWCVVAPEGVVPNWGPNGEITFCIADPMDETSCATILPDTRDGGLIVVARPGGTDAPPDEPIMHKFLLVGEDGLLVLTAPPSTDPTAMHMDFPLWFAACPVDVDPVDCELMMNAHVGELDLPFAGCAFDNDALIQCAPQDDTSDVPMDPFSLNFAQINYFPFDPDLPIAGCAYDNDALIQCDNPNTPDGAPADPQLPFAGCAFDNDALIQCDNPNTPDGATFDPDLPIAGCAYDNDKLVQCSNNEDAGGVGIFNGGEFFLGIGGEEPTATREHILLARQVGVPAMMEDPTNADVGLVLGDFDDDGDTEIGLLLPAIQKVREAAARM